MFYLATVSLIDTYGHPDDWTFRNGMAIVAVKYVLQRISKENAT